MISTRILPVLAAAFILSAISARSQDVAVTGLLSDVPAAGGVFDYTLTLQNTGSQAIESLWLGWALSSNPVFDISSPTQAGNNLGWNNFVDGNSVQFGGLSTETFLAPRASATFTFDSTSTPGEFMSQAAGQSVAYGVDASPFAIEDNSLNSVEFAPTVAAVPEPSTVGLLIMAAIGISSLGWCSRFLAPSPCRSPASPMNSSSINKDSEVFAPSAQCKIVKGEVKSEFTFLWAETDEWKPNSEACEIMDDTSCPQSSDPKI